MKAKSKAIFILSKDSKHSKRITQGYPPKKGIHLNQKINCNKTKQISTKQSLKDIFGNGYHQP